MKSKLVGIALTMSVSSAFGQTSISQNSAGQYIEGARVVIDILQLFKKNTPSRAQKPFAGKGRVCNFCLVNSDSTRKIIVTIYNKEIDGSDTSRLVIKPREKECSLRIPCGVHNCKIETPEGGIISWGDIAIDEREITVTK